MCLDTHQLRGSHVMSRRLPREDGWALVTAMMVMSTMLFIGLAAIAFVDTESRSSGRERQAEARLNLTEGALATELYQLSHDWPTASPGFDDCTETSTPASAPRCFTVAQLKANYQQVDFSLGPKWKVQVRDDAGAAPANPGVCDPSASGMGGYYNDSILAGANYDANRNCQLWVRAEGTLRGSKRVVVAKVRVDTRPVQFPIAPFVSGSFNTGNNSGSKVIVDGAGQTGQVRCDSSTSGCVDFASGQLTQPGSVASDQGLSDNVVDPAMVEALRATAKQNGSYYSTATPGKTTCPADPSGAVVFVEDLSCSYQAGAVVNGTTKQGIFIINRGTLEISGNREWWGAIYLVNAQGCGTVTTGPCINSSAGHKDVVAEITGTVTVHGGIFVDGKGRLTLGSSGNSGTGNLPNLMYDPSVFPPLQAYGTAGIIQNTWRELTAG
jgi:hypothetical protein